MARQKAFDPPEDDVPAWVMTFSDVITLLMTFFILLLTFATNTPETFDRMQVSMFGGGGSTGFAGSTEGMEKDSLLVPDRARTGRIAKDGSHIPPMYSDPALSTLDKGIAGLEKDEMRVLGTIHQLRQSLKSVVDAKGNLTPLCRQQLKLLSRQLRKRPLNLDIVVNNQDELPAALAIVEHLGRNENVPVAKVGVGVAEHKTDSGQVLMIIANQGASRGEKD